MPVDEPLGNIVLWSNYAAMKRAKAWKREKAEAGIVTTYCKDTTSMRAGFHVGGAYNPWEPPADFVVRQDVVRLVFDLISMWYVLVIYFVVK